MAARRFGMATARVAAPDFDLALTLHSGQVFHWRAEGAGFAGAIGDAAVYVEPGEGSLLVAPAGAADLVRRYFALDHPLAEIRDSFPADDAVLASAAASCAGLRIIRQPLVGMHRDFHHLGHEAGRPHSPDFRGAAHAVRPGRAGGRT